MSSIVLVDGNYTTWGDYSQCVPTCGNGTQIRQRTCANPRPVHGGKTCLEQGLGDDTEERPCSNGPCPGVYTFFRSHLNALSLGISAPFAA